MTTIAANLQAVMARIAMAAGAAGRKPDEVSLLAVSKTWPAECVLAAWQAGQRCFGENYVQEAVDKMGAVAAAGIREIEWHFIGPLQSNKTRQVAEHFQWVHSVDRLKIAERLSQQRDVHLPPLNICLQVNVSGEASKSGVAPHEVGALAAGVAQLPGLRLRGLMAIPEPSEDTGLLRQRFAMVRALYTQLRADGLPLDTLSMGMSHDLESAVAEGASIVRVGTAIFGARDYSQTHP